MRLLFIAHYQREGKVVDTKKPFLDAFATSFKSRKSTYVRSLKDEVSSLLDGLTPIFVDKDTLLMAQSIVPIYMLVYRDLIEKGEVKKFSRTRLIKFNDNRSENRSMAESSILDVDFDLLEYDRLSQQGTNDASSIRERWRILAEKILGKL